MLGALVAYCALLSVAGARVQPELLARGNWGKSLSCLPIMVVAFTFHNIVPSLLSYLGSAKLVSRAVVLGSLLPLGLYILWQLAILGTVHVGAGVSTAADVVRGISAVAGPWATAAVQVFSFFAIVTSFLGVGLGCVDFVADLLGLNREPPEPAIAGATGGGGSSNGVSMNGSGASGQVSSSSLGRVERERKGVTSRKLVSLALRRLVPLATTMLPPFIIALSCPSIFLSALEFSGTFRLVLFAIFPALMVWKGRYRDDERPWLPGGKPLLVAIISVATCVISFEWISLIAKRAML